MEKRPRTRSDDGIAVVGTLERSGPLGASNRSRQLGRSDVLGTVLGERCTLVSSGSRRAEQGGPSFGESLAQSVIFTCTRTITPNAAQLLANPGNLKNRIEGILKWGNDGHQAEARFDWVQGTTVRAPAGFVRLEAEVVAELDGALPTSDIVVGAFAAYGQNWRGATLTRRAETTAEAPTASFSVPAFARSFSLWFTGSSATLDFFAGTTILYSTPIVTTLGQPLTLPGGVDRIDVTGSSDGPQVMVWHLDI